jgi:hypothetical protein
MHRYNTKPEEGDRTVTQTIPTQPRTARIDRTSVTVAELLDLLWNYMVRHDDYPTRAELHKQHRGVLPTVRQAISLRYVAEQLDPDGLMTLRITQKGYDLLRELDGELPRA